MGWDLFRGAFSEAGSAPVFCSGTLHAGVFFFAAQLSIYGHHFLPVNAVIYGTDMTPLTELNKTKE